MASINFKDVIGYKKLSSCSSCDSHEYSLPFPITKEIGAFLEPLGALKFSLEQVSLVRLDNEFLDIQARVGRTTVRVKFKNDEDGSRRAEFEAQLAKYLEQMMLEQGVQITF